MEKGRRAGFNLGLQFKISNQGITSVNPWQSWEQLPTMPCHPNHLFVQVKLIKLSVKAVLQDLPVQAEIDKSPVAVDANLVPVLVIQETSQFHNRLPSAHV